MDRRRRKTRQAVFEAFTGLLETKSYSNISVQDIIDRADIGRSTFYSHFETKDDLLKALGSEIFDHVFSDHLTRENTHAFSVSGKDPRTEVTHILYHLRDSKAYIKGILSCESGEIFMCYFKKYLRNLFEDELNNYDQDVPREYLLNHLTGAFAETVRWWMDHEEYSPEEISGFFFSTIPSN